MRQFFYPGAADLCIHIHDTRHMSASWCACETVDKFAINGGCWRCYVQARRIGSFLDLLYAAQFRRSHLILGHSWEFSHVGQIRKYQWGAAAWLSEDSNHDAYDVKPPRCAATRIRTV